MDVIRLLVWQVHWILNLTPGKFFADGTSSYETGNVVASLPEGLTFPLRTSAIAFPVSCPAACKKNSIGEIPPAETSIPPYIKITIVSCLSP